MIRAIAQGILAGVAVLAVIWLARYASQPHYDVPAVFYPYHHVPAAHLTRWFPRQYGH